MADNNLEARIRACIDSFVEELSSLVRQAAVESVQEALGAGAPARRRPGRPAAAAPRRSKAGTRRKASGKRVRRSSEVVDTVADAVQTFVRANPGVGVGEIGGALGLSSKDMRLPIQKLLSEGRLRTTGQRRGTKYHPAGRGGAGAGRKKATRKKAGRKKAARKKAAKRRTRK